MHKASLAISCQHCMHTQCPWQSMALRRRQRLNQGGPAGQPVGGAAACSGCSAGCGSQGVSVVRSLHNVVLDLAPQHLLGQSQHLRLRCSHSSRGRSHGLVQLRQPPVHRKSLRPAMQRTSAHSAQQKTPELRRPRILPPYPGSGFKGPRALRCAVLRCAALRRPAPWPRRPVSQTRPRCPRCRCCPQSRTP